MCARLIPRHRSLWRSTLLLVVLVASLACAPIEPSEVESPSVSSPEPTATPVVESQLAPPSPTAAVASTVVEAAAAVSLRSPVADLPTATAVSDPLTSAEDATATPSPSGAPSATGEMGLIEGLTPTPAAAAPSVRYQARRGVIALDPGHGGPEPGAVSARGLAEKDVNLQIALALAALLREAGFEPVLTRESDSTVSSEYHGGGYSGGLGRDLQARVDVANASGAELFLSIHNNGHNDPSVSGTEVWYNASRPFSDRNLLLAQLLQRHLVAEIRGIGHDVVDRGVKDDANFRVFQGRVFNIYVLGPGTGARPHVPTMMPGVLGESLFLSNPTEAALLERESTIQAIARGYFRAIQEYFDETQS